MSEIIKIKVSEFPVQNELENLHLHGITPGAQGSVRVPISKVIEAIDAKAGDIEGRLNSSIQEVETELNDRITALDKGLVRSESASDIKVLSQSEYDSLPVKDNNTLYLILED